MLELPRWKIVLVPGRGHLRHPVHACPTSLPDDVLAKLPAFLPHQRLNLGLDLQGGSLAAATRSTPTR